MVRQALSLLFVLLAFGAGIYGGEFLRPGAARVDEATATESDGVAAGDAQAVSVPDIVTPTGNPAWMSFANQFFVPMMRDGNMTALMILTLTIETREGALENLRKHEHRLRDAILRQLMIEANSGAFDGNYTAEPFSRRLREALLEAAQSAGGDEVEAVLIEDIVRQVQ